MTSVASRRLRNGATLLALAAFLPVPSVTGQAPPVPTTCTASAGLTQALANVGVTEIPAGTDPVAFVIPTLRAQPPAKQVEVMKWMKTLDAGRMAGMVAPIQNQGPGLARNRHALKLVDVLIQMCS